MKINCRLRATGGLLQKNFIAYPKAIDAGRIEGKEFVEKLEHNCNVTPAMAQAVFSGMADELLKNLMLGHSVEVPGLGVFRVDVKGKVRERKSGAKYIDGGKCSICFVPKIELGEKLNEVTLNVVSDRVGENVSLSDEETLRLAGRLLDKHPWFSTRRFAEEANVSLSYARHLLNRLTDKNLLRKQKEGSVCIFSRPE